MFFALSSIGFSCGADDVWMVKGSDTATDNNAPTTIALATLRLFICDLLRVRLARTRTLYSDNELFGRSEIRVMPRRDQLSDRLARQSARRLVHPAALNVAQHDEANAGRPV